MNPTLLIWFSKESAPRYFLIPEKQISKDLLETIRRASNLVFSEDNTDEEHEDLWAVKSAVSDKSVWVPKKCKKYLGALIPFERYAPVHDEISLVLAIGSKSR